MLPKERREVPFLQRCDRFDELLEQLVSEGVRIDDSSRFRFYSKLLRAFAAQGDTADQFPEDDAMRIGSASAEVGELLEALELLLRPPRIEGWLPRLQIALAGHAIPVGGPDPARNAQFELVVAASCRKAGGDPLFAEPDIKVRVERRTLAIAAKRLQSFGSLEKHTSKARKQIAIASKVEPDLLGVIAYDLTPALGFERSIAIVNDLHEVGEQYKRTGRRIAEAGRRIDEWASKQPNIRAVAVYARFCLVIKSSKHFAGVRPWYCESVSAITATAAPLRKFLQRWGRLAPAASPTRIG